jgi:hypothetical protein
MSTLDIEDRLAIMEMVAEIASGAGHNPNVADMAAFQEELVERLYRKMIALIEEDEPDDEDVED